MASFAIIFAWAFSQILIFKNWTATKSMSKPSNGNADNSLNPNASSSKGVVKTAGKVGKSHHEYFKISSQHQPAAQIRGISAEELAQHKSQQSAWLSLNGTVYDVTVYLSYHPGGKILLDGCGKECINLFNQHHPWVNAQYLLEKYRIGYLKK